MPSVPINVSTATTTAVVAAAAGKRYRVHAYLIQAGGTGNFTWKSATNVLSGPMPQVANSGVCAPFNPDGWFDTNVGEALNLVTDAAVQVSGHVSYSVIG